MTYNLIHGGDSTYAGSYSESKKGPTTFVNQIGVYPAGGTRSHTDFSEDGSPKKRKSWISRLKFFSPAWEHPLPKNQRLPSESDDVRYFKRSRQTRRVLIDCLIVWSWTVFVCAGIFGVIWYFSSIRTGISQQQKYSYNASMTGLSILLGLAFSAQFKQYCEMLRWRFLASGYRSLSEFQDVMSCDSWRTVMRLIVNRHGKGSKWYPAKSQIIAFCWLLIFVGFNVVAAVLGLTYSIDVSNEFSDLAYGNVSAAELKYISLRTVVNGTDYPPLKQMGAANLWGLTGQSYETIISDYSAGIASRDPSVNTGPLGDVWWHVFVDFAGDGDVTNHVVTGRTVNVTATCEELELLVGGYAGHDDNGNIVQWTDRAGVTHERAIVDVNPGGATWMGNMSSDCGDRCTEILVLQSANNLTAEDIQADRDLADQNPVPTPRMWTCSNTVDQITNYDSPSEGFDQPELIAMPDTQAKFLAGAIGWSGVLVADLEDANEVDELQYSIVRGDEPLFNPAGNATVEAIAGAVMKFTTGAIAAMDQPNGHRQIATGTGRPKLAQVINVKWKFVAAILGGLPLTQFVMLLLVVWTSGKAVILEPSSLTTARLFYPVMRQLDQNGGALMSAEEIEDKFGGGFKVSYAVRPEADDPGPHEKNYTRTLGLLRESEGFGYVRGKMPEGKYA